MFNLINHSLGGTSSGGFAMSHSFGMGGTSVGMDGFGGFGGMGSLASGFGLGVSGGAGGGYGMDPFAMMQSSMMGMMSMMMGMMTQGMMGSLMGAGGLSPVGGGAMNPMFGTGGAMGGGGSLSNIGSNFLGAGPSRKSGQSRGPSGASGAETAGGDYVANSPGVASMLKKAGSMVGLQEGRDRAKIQKITGKSGINPATTPWCAAFAMNLIKDHGLDDLKGLTNRNYCPTIESWARGKGKYGTPGKYKPKPGDAILFDWGGKKGTTDHIGIVEKVENGKVYTIEGNSGNAVSRKVYPLNSSDIDGYVITGKKRK